MQNAVDHAFPPGDAAGLVEGSVRVAMSRDGDELVVDVIDDGVGLPPGFDLAENAGLGLSIVQTLVTTEMGGAIDLRDDHGTCVRIRVPVAATRTDAASAS